MQTHFLTIPYILKGRFFSFFEKIMNPKVDNIHFDLKGYTQVKSIREGELKIGIYITANNKKVIIKALRYAYKNLLYELILNEINMLNLLKTLSLQVKSHINIGFPKLYKTYFHKNELVAIREFSEGKKLFSYDQDFKLNVITACLDYFKDLSKKLSQSYYKKIPKRTALQTTILFPIYFVIDIFKEPTKFILYIRLFYIFYKEFFSFKFWNTAYTLSHRDLTSDNVIIKGNDIQIIDLETAILAEEETDIALFPRFYMYEIEKDKILGFLKKQLQSSKKKSNFKRLTIFYTFQLMSAAAKDNKYYKEALEYAQYFYDNILLVI